MKRWERETVASSVMFSLLADKAIHSSAKKHPKTSSMSNSEPSDHNHNISARSSHMTSRTKIISFILIPDPSNPLEVMRALFLYISPVTFTLHLWPITTILQSFFCTNTHWQYYLECNLSQIRFSLFRSLSMAWFDKLARFLRWLISNWKGFI